MALGGSQHDGALSGARAAGVAVIAASASSEASFETPEWGHGLFTVALLRGLEGRAAFAGEQRVGVSNLVRYVARHLPILSERFTKGGRQTATHGMSGSDFTLAQVAAEDPPLLAGLAHGRGAQSRGTGARRGVSAAIMTHVGCADCSVGGCSRGAHFASPGGQLWRSPSWHARACRERARSTSAATPRPTS